jgi:Uma2 family endonuclease
MSTASRLITYEESFLLPEDKCEEIVKGELRKMPPPSLRHARLVERLALLLRKGLSSDFEVLVSAFGQAIRKEPFTYRVPDLAVYLRSRLGDDHYIWAVPELLVEVISPANRKGDLGELIEDYDFLQAPEVWLVDLEKQRIARLLREGGKLREAGLFADSISPVRLEGVAVPLEELWKF